MIATTSREQITQNNIARRYRTALAQSLADFDTITATVTIYGAAFNAAANLTDDLGVTVALPILRTLADGHRARYAEAASKDSDTRKLIYHGHTANAYEQAAEVLENITNN